MQADAIPVGNYENKYDSANPLARLIVNTFLTSFDRLVERASPSTVLEVGCGEGELIRRLTRTKATAIKGVDISSDIFEQARAELDPNRFSFEELSVYDLNAERDSADLVICCEVLEHLDDPAKALGILHSLNARTYILSVPREPLWRVMNMARLKYLGDFGNTPGHVNHWSQSGFLKMIAAHFEILAIETPTPWTMALCAPK